MAIGSMGYIGFALADLRPVLHFRRIDDRERFNQLTIGITTMIFTNEDCMDLMARYHDKHFDLAIVDPPYGININNSMGRRKGDAHSCHKKVKWDNETPNENYFKELFRVSKNQIMWGANYYISKFYKDTSCWIMWDKKLSAELSFSQFEMAWTSFDSMCRKYERVNNIGCKIHPTQKPVALYKWLLKNYAKEGDLILDTHVGSASSLIACEEMGFDYVGCELDKDYYEMACKRIEKFREQGRLF